MGEFMNLEGNNRKKPLLPSFSPDTVDAAAHFITNLKENGTPSDEKKAPVQPPAPRNLAEIADSLH